VTEAAEKVAQELRGELDRVRADAEAEVAASREWAAGEAAAVREAADAEVARAYAAADDAIRSAKAVVSRAKSIQPLSVPVPSFDFRPQIGHIEKALNALQGIDYVLEVDMANESRSPTSGTSSPRNAAGSSAQSRRRSRQHRHRDARRPVGATRYFMNPIAL